MDTISALLPEDGPEGKGDAASGPGSREPSPSVSAVPASIPIANGPELWDALLALMPKGSVIAGGAVRDYLLGVEPKDIDIFMGEYAGTCEPEPKETPAFCFTDFSIPDPRCGLFRIDNEHERFEEYAAVSDIMMVSSGTLLGVKVDAVLIDKFEGGEKLIKDFDFGITRCWYDGAIHDTPEAQSDRKRCVVTLLSDEREVRSIARFERLNARWGGGWKLERDASAIEARRAETGTGSVEDESAIPEGDAHV